MNDHTAVEHTAWRCATNTTGWRSRTVLTLLVALGLTWLGWPVWDSLGNPTRAQIGAEAPWVAGALVAGLALLAAALWRDSGRRSDTLAVVTLLVVATCVVRAVLSPASSGVEFVHALPLLAGMALGAPAGFLTGASAALLSTLLVGTPAETLPNQALVWGLVGASGGLLRGLRPTPAWLCSLPLAVLAGVASGVLLNLMGWAQEPGTSTTHFHPGLPATEVIARLWAYTVETSLVHDTTRGVTTALALLVLGRPLLGALRPTPVDRGLTTAPTGDLSDRALARRDDRTRLDQLWS